jgi:hypothetical protein
MLYYDQFYFKEKPVFRFEYPFDGGVLQEGTGYPILGTETGADGVKRLRIHVVVRPGDVGNLQVFDPEGTVIPMEYISGALMGTALLKDRLSVLKARGTRNGKPVEFTCRVLWAKNAYKRYQCYIDDHSFCFRDILQRTVQEHFRLLLFRETPRTVQTLSNEDRPELLQLDAGTRLYPFDVSGKVQAGIRGQCRLAPAGFPLGKRVPR